MRPDNPVREMLFREIHAVKLLIHDIKEKMETLDYPEEPEKKQNESSPT